jgi:hypothetical protein
MGVVVACCAHAHLSRVDADRPTALLRHRPNLSNLSNRETAQCLADSPPIIFCRSSCPDRETGPGCGLRNRQLVIDIGVPVASLTAVRCGAARTFIG